jgi:hypothetical protein
VSFNTNSGGQLNKRIAVVVMDIDMDVVIETHSHVNFLPKSNLIFTSLVGIAYS